MDDVPAHLQFAGDSPFSHSRSVQSQDQLIASNALVSTDLLLAFGVGQEERSPSLKTSHLFPMLFQYISNVVSIHRCYAVICQEKFLSSALFTKVNYDESCHKGIQKEIQKI